MGFSEKYELLKSHIDAYTRTDGTVVQAHDNKVQGASTFVSDSPSTNCSRGVTFQVKKDKVKSVGEHEGGFPVEHHDVYHEGKRIGSVSSYSSYSDKKAPGARVATSRKSIRSWQANVIAGGHNRDTGRYGGTPISRDFDEMGHKTKAQALQRVADAHKSNQLK